MIKGLREFNGQKYTGMPVNGEHHWNYTDAIWDEIKVSPGRWRVRFTSIKQRRSSAPKGSGVPTGTEYHWYLIGSQKVIKLDENRYQTELIADKFKIGHKRPYWKKMSYEYEGQKTEKERTIEALKEAIKQLEEQ